MAAPKGHPQYGGRKKGTPNRYTQNLMAICKEKGLDVFEAMIEIALDKGDENRFHSLKELARYLYPTRKAIEHSGEIDTNPYRGKSVKELKELVKERFGLVDGGSSPRGE